MLANRRPDAVLPPRPGDRRCIRFYLIKATRYDDDGYVLRYRWGVVPSHTLIVVAGLLESWAAQRRDVCVQTVLWDELVDGCLSEDVIRSVTQRAREDGVELIVGLAGVQTNQYPRARDIGLQFRRLGTTVVMGGFHVSSVAATREFLASTGITAVIGEAENTFSVLLEDYLRGELKACYQVSDGVRAKTGGADITVPVIENAPLPSIDTRYVRRFFNPTFSTIDTSRGCPFVCSYCSVKNVMGRTMRSRDAAAVVDWLAEAHDRHGIRNVLVVDDDLFRSPAWEAVFLGIARLRREGRDISLLIQTDIESATFAPADDNARSAERPSRARRFVELAAAAGCFEVFMGFESFNPANLAHVLKFHNQDRRDRRSGAEHLQEAAVRLKARYRQVVENWHAAGVGVHCGYIIGFPFDGAGCGAQAGRDLAEIGVDIASFFAFTPLPGTEDYDRALAAGTIFNHDWNDFDSTHFVAEHPLLTRAELAAEYRAAYRHFFTWKRLGWSLGTGHRVAGLGTNARLGMLAQQIYFTYATRRGWHPMIGGIWRIRDRERRIAVGDEDARQRYLRGDLIRASESPVTAQACADSP